MLCKDTRDHRIPRMMVTLKGRYKGKNNLQRHCVPLVDQKNQDTNKNVGLSDTMSYMCSG